MTIYLKQSTASQEIPLGIMVDSTDGNTTEEALTIANTDIKLWKTGATTLANKNSGGATHISGGIYYAVLDATDTDTIGPLVVFCHPSGALAVKVDCVVLSANVYDSMVGGSANLAVDAVAISGDTVAADNLEAALDGTGYNVGNGDIVAASVTGAVGSVTGNVTLADGHITAAKIATDAITDEKLAASAAVEIAAAVWDRVLTGATHNISNSAGRRLRSIPETIGSTIVDATPTTTEFATALAGSYVDDHFNDQVLHIISGDVASQVGVIVDYVGATGTITLDEPLTAAPANGDAFEILSTHVHPKSQIADAIWDELKAGHIAAGSFGEEVQSHALSTEVDAVPTVSEIWAGLGDTEKNAIADALLTRGVSNVEDTAGAATLCELVLAAFESSMPVGSSTWTIKKTDGVTTFNTRTVTTDASAEGITSVT